jgi:pimeloyl-ACP methyl ester carboxylesterase
MSGAVDTPQGPVAHRVVGEGPPIVFVHGLLVDSKLWDGVAERLADRHRCIVADWPMGSHRLAMNDDADLTPPGLARIIALLMDELGIERATIVGNDTGGAVSQILTANHPERVERLVLTNCDTFEHFPPFPFNLLPKVARLPGGLSLLQAPQRFAAVRRMGYAPLVKRPLSQELVDSWIEPAAGDPTIRRDLLKILRGIHKRHTLEAAEKLRGFERPVRFAWATDDRFFKRAHAERLAALLQDARIEDIPGAGTFVPLDEPGRVAELVAEFVAEGVPAGTQT